MPKPTSPAANKSTTEKPEPTRKALSIYRVGPTWNCDSLEYRGDVIVSRKTEAGYRKKEVLHRILALCLKAITETIK